MKSTGNLVRLIVVLASVLLALGCGSSAPTAPDDPPRAVPVPYLVQDISAASGGSAPAGPAVALGSTLLFEVGGSTRSKGLWRTDGTAAGTSFLKTLPYTISGFATLDGAAFFTINNTYALWRSDGTAAGTGVLKEFPRYPVTESLRQLTAVGHSLFFIATRGPGAARPSVLWRSDGTPEGTEAVQDFRLAFATGFPGPQQVAGVNGRLLFGADDGTHGNELWSSDGTASGTRLVKDVVPGPNADAPETLVALPDAVLFFPRLPANYMELWRSDGTPAGTQRVRALGPRSLPQPCVARRLVFFAGNDGIHGEELWRSDGTESGTHMVKDIHPSSSSFPLSLTAVGSIVYFVANDGVHGAELWRSDGTAAGTRLVKDIVRGPGDSLPGSLIDGSGRLFFLVADDAHGEEMWTSDGTEAGTVLVQDIVPGPDASHIDWLGAAGDLLYFSVTRRLTHGPGELWAMVVSPSK